MKALFTLLSLFVGASAYANHIGPAGCGLGNVILGKENQIFAATLNATGYQTFAITTGTSNCTDQGGTAKLESYVEANQVALSKEMARGQGESLVGLTEVLGCRDNGDVKAVLKNNFQNIYSNENLSAHQISNNILRTLKSYKVAACNRVG